VGGWRGCGWVLIRALLLFFNFIIYKTVFFLLLFKEREKRNESFETDL